ncbi:hypothetical protein ACFXMT_00235 [Streptomyces mirabilis]|uniref:hypothetical protein n=1 Tax=Streptomyces mirabilis TaxID=68239 RepID=UPI0036A8D7D2
MRRATALRVRAAQPAGSGEAVGGRSGRVPVVQEAFANTAKHAVCAKATVTVEYGTDVVAEASPSARSNATPAGPRRRPRSLPA